MADEETIGFHAAMEQFSEMGADVAKTLARFYATLIEGGMSPEAANTIVTRLFDHLMPSANPFDALFKGISDG